MAEEKRPITIEELEEAASREAELSESENDMQPVSKKENLYDRMNISVGTLDKVIIGSIAIIVLLVIIGMNS